MPAEEVMKHTHAILFSFFTFVLFIQNPIFSMGKKDNSSNDERSNEVIAYTYDSFVGEWGPGNELIKLFKEKTGMTLTLVDCGDAVQAFKRATLEGSSPYADVVIGLDNSLAEQAEKSGLFAPYIAKGSDSIPAELKASLKNSNLFTPYDYGYFAIIYDTKSTIEPPKSLLDLTRAEYKKKLILMNPRTSTPGIGFVNWTRTVLGDDFSEYWKNLRENILTLSPSWSAGWGMFLSGEAPLVVSYNTSPAYNVEYENNDQFVTLIFDEGHIAQVEAAAILKNAKNAEGAKIFMDFLISPEAQAILPLTQWMYPANSRVPLPASYKKAAPLPLKTLIADTEKTEEAIDTVISILGN